MRLLLGRTLREEEVDAGRLGTEFACRVVDAARNVDNIATLLSNRCAQRDVAIGDMDRLTEANIHTRRNSARLEFAEQHPATQLVEQCRLHASVQRIEPTLMLGGWSPAAHNLLAIFVELHSQAVFVLRVATVAVVALDFEPRIDNLSHSAYLHIYNSKPLPLIEVATLRKAA